MAEQDPVLEVKAWLKDNWDPNITVGEWWERLGLAGWSAPALPTNAYGRGLTQSDAVRVAEAISNHGALSAPGGLGLMLAAPTIAMFGTQEQIDRFVKPIVTGQHAWCQLFSEPGAGSDLAGLSTKAEKDGDEWVINGQKVWTSNGHFADMGMLIARSDGNLPKHQGITYFAFNMKQPGVDIRPLREMTGHALFNEVFLTDARVNEDSRISDVNNGWAVANATLMFERASLGAGGGHASSSAAMPGSIAGDLSRRVGDFVKSEDSETDVTMSIMSSAASVLLEIARNSEIVKDPTIRQDLMRLHSISEIGRYSTLRAKAARLTGKPDIPGLPNIGKLSMSQMVRLGREIGMRMLGAEAMLHAYTSSDAKELRKHVRGAMHAEIMGMALVSPAPSIYGGSDQVQRNVIGERVLGLPKEPNNDKTMAFKDMLKNT